MPLPRLIACAALLVLAAGCVRLGERFEPQALPAGAPDPAEILADLARNDEAIRHFTATGVFTLKSPKIDAVHRLTESRIVFEGPDRLHVLGRKYGRAGLRLASVGPAFLLELPTERAFYFRPEGESFESVGFNVSPVDIAREAFLPERWSALAPGQVRLLRFYPATGRAVISVASRAGRGRPHRLVEVQGAPWIVLRSELYDRDGTLLSVTEKSEYRDLDGYRFPARVALTFPAESAYMTFAMRRIDLSAPADAALFDVAGRVAALRAAGERELQSEDFEELTW
jgi:hypothetical protein